MARFVVTCTPGPAWESATPTRQQAGWDAHATFMNALAQERFVAFGGPAGEENNVVLIADARDDASVRARLALDPWSTAGLLRTVSIEPWTIWLGDDERIPADQSGSLYLVAYAPGPRWEHPKPRRGQAGWDAHAKFMDALTEQRVVLLGGPLDEHRALLVMQHEHEDDLRAQLATDLWYDGVLRIKYIEPWTLWLHRSQAST